MRGVSFLFIALPDFYRIYQFACTVYIIPVPLFRLTSFVHVPSFTLFSPIALNIVSSSTVTRYINLSSSRDRRSRFPFLVALSNDVQSYVYLVAQRFFLSSLRTYTHKKNTHTGIHTDTERTSMKSSDDILKIWVGKKKKGECTRHATRTRTRTRTEKNTGFHGKWKDIFFMLRCWEDVYAHLVTHVVNNAQFPATLVAASLLRETRLQVKKATERREPLARFICGWTGGAPIWCQRYRRHVTDRRHPGVARARRPSHVRQVGLTPCPGWTNWRSLGNVRQNLAHWRNSKASLWALLAWVAACHI